MPTSTVFTLIIFFSAYLLGSLSAAIITCKLTKLPDPRTTGSQNPGATNVLRSGGKKLAAATLLGDMLKGLLAVAIARYIGADDTALAAAGLGVFIGHLLPIFFRFRGGKGVATALGALLGLSWITGLLAIATWLAISLSVRISSVAALVTFTFAPLYFWLLGGPEVIAYTLTGITVLLYWRHRNNIVQLLAGNEPRIGEHRPTQSAGDGR